MNQNSIFSWSQFQEDIRENVARHEAFKQSLLGSPDQISPHEIDNTNKEVIPFGYRMISTEELSTGLLCDLDPDWGKDWNEERLKDQIRKEERTKNTILDDDSDWRNRTPKPDNRNKKPAKINQDLSKFGSETLKQMIKFGENPIITKLAKDELSRRQ